MDIFEETQRRLSNEIPELVSKIQKQAEERMRYFQPKRKEKATFGSVDLELIQSEENIIYIFSHKMSNTQAKDIFEKIQKCLSE